MPKKLTLIKKHKIGQLYDNHTIDPNIGDKSVNFVRILYKQIHSMSFAYQIDA